MTQEMCDKAVNRCVFIFYSVPNRYKTQEMCDRVDSEDPFLREYCPDKYKTQTMCDEAVDDSLAALNFVPDWFVTSEMIKRICTALYPNENILYVNEDSGNVVFCCNEVAILNIDLNILILIIILMKMILILLFLSGFWFGILNLKNSKYLKKDK